MLSPFILLLACAVLGWLYTRAAPQTIYADGTIYTTRRNDVAHTARFTFWMIVLILIWFGGLRTRMNDTATYIIDFKKIVPNAHEAFFEMNWGIASGPLFDILQILIKSFLSQNAQSFLLVSAVITTCSFVCFLRRYSPDFGFSLFIFIAYTVYAFTLAAMRQTLATAILIWAIPAHIERKRARTWILTGLAVLIHPYSIILALGFFLGERVWDWKIILIFLSAVMLAGLGNSGLTKLVTAVYVLIGKESSVWALEGNTGVSWQRVLTYMVGPVLSFRYRRRLRQMDNHYVTTFVNMSIVPAAIGVIALQGVGLLLGRLMGFFDMTICVALPIVLQYGIQNEKLRRIIKYVAIPLYCGFYFAYYNKYGMAYAAVGQSWLTSDFYRRTTILQLLQNW